MSAGCRQNSRRAGSNRVSLGKGPRDEHMGIFSPRLGILLGEVHVASSSTTTRCRGRAPRLRGGEARHWARLVS